MSTIEADVFSNQSGALAGQGLRARNSLGDGAQQIEAFGSDVNASEKAVGPVAAFFQRPVVRTSLPYFGLAFVILLAAVAYFSLSASPLRPLYPEMADADKEAAQQVLRKSGVTVKLDPLSGSLMVPASEFHEAKIQLAAAGLPKEAPSGVSALSEKLPLGTSQFMEQARYNASIEEELAQSIRRINTIRDARVHLALPRQSAFVRDRVDPKASVIITPFAGRTVNEGQVQAIVHLVASSIPYMNPQGVSVVDQFGRLLTDDPNSKDQSNKQLELRQKVESDYAERITQILSPIFGAANVRAQVNADLDFSVIEQSVENFDPNNSGTKVRSEQLKQSQRNEPKLTGIPGSLSNEPPANTTATPTANVAEDPAGKDQNSRTEEKSEAKNYEIDRSIRYVVDPAPRLRRLTVGVAINDAIVAPGATAAPTRKPLPKAEIDRLVSIVQGAIGYNESRGDLVNIISTSFEPPVVEKPLPIWQQPQYIDMAKYGAVTLAITLAALLIIRPIIKKITYIPPVAETVAAGAGAALLTGPDASLGADAPSADGPAEAGDASPDGVEIQEGETLEELKARLKPKKKTTISAEMLDTANSYDDKVTVVRMLVSQDSKRVALVLKNLITRDLS